MAKLTDAFIRSLQVPEGGKDVQAFDDSCPGFGVRKFAKGHASYFVKYTIGKQQRRKTLRPFVPGAARRNPQGGRRGPRPGKARDRCGGGRQEGAARGRASQEDGRASGPLS